jgi:hypothetical protein
MLMKRLLLILGSSFVILISSFAAEQRPNILLVLVDDMGFSDLGCYGSEIETPNMDKLHAVLQHRQVPFLTRQPAQRTLVPSGGG